MVRRLLPSLALLAALVPFVTGCGAGGTLSLDPVAAAATKTGQAGAYDFDFKLSFSVAGQSIAMSGDGVADPAANAMQMSFDFSGLPSSLTQAGTKGEAVMTGTTMYMKLPFLQSLLPSGKEWFSIDLAQVSAASGSSFPTSSLTFDPQQQLQELLASGNTQNLGTDTVQGEQMTHYRTVVDPANLGHLSADRRATITRALKQAGMGTLPVDVWVDGNGMLRREQLSLSSSKLRSFAMTMTLDLTQFGVVANIAAPPSSDVLDATHLLSRGAKPKS